MHISRPRYSTLVIASLSLLLAVFAGASSDASGRSFVLHAPAELVESGILKFLIPRFSLKNATRVNVSSTPEGAHANLNNQGKGLSVIQGPNDVWSFEITGSDNQDATARFEKWLTSETGRRTIAAFTVDGKNPYSPADLQAKKKVVKVKSASAVIGEEISQARCGRCHMVNEKTRLTTIGSTPSFALMRGFEDWENRFLGFYALRPHPAFTIVEDVTPPFDPERPSPIHPIKVTLDEIDAITAYVESIEPTDLGAPLQVQ